VTAPCRRWRDDGWERPEITATTLASDRERDDVVQALVRHHVDGRLSEVEFEERTDQAVGARTIGDLRAVLVDLPPIDGGRAATSGRTGRSPRVAFLPVVLIAPLAVAALVASHGRAAFGFVWFFVIVAFVRSRARVRWR
jgi:hypothetical protein